MTQPLADLGLELIEPHPALKPYVRSFWRIQHELPADADREEFMHPRGGYGFVFNFGAIPRLDARPIGAPVFLDGATTISRRMGFAGRIDLLGVSFHEGGAYPFFNIPLHELRDEVDALDNCTMRDLHAQLLDQPSTASRITLLEQWLIGRLAQGGTARDPIIPASLAALRQHQGQVAIPTLAETFAVSQRQLERLYLMQVGVSPVQYAQLVRVEVARLKLKTLAGTSAAGLAADLGFFDQAHFIRSFKRVVGMTPGAYIKRSMQRRDSRLSRSD